MEKYRQYAHFSVTLRLLFKPVILPKKLERGAEVLQFDVCCKAIDQNFDCGCDRCAILRLDSLLVGIALTLPKMLWRHTIFLSECPVPKWAWLRVAVTSRTKRQFLMRAKKKKKTRSLQ